MAGIELPKTFATLVSFVLICLVISSVSGVQSKLEAQDFQLTDIHGKSFSLSDSKGKVVVLEFFASWCGPCKPQLTELKVIRAAYPEEQLAMASISFDPATDTDESLSRLAENMSVTWILARDTTGVSDTYQVNIAPTIFLIDRTGFIRYAHEGFTKSNLLKPEVEQLISEPPPAAPPKSPSGTDITPLFLLIVAIILGGSVLLVMRRRKPKRKARRPRS